MYRYLPLFLTLALLPACRTYNHVVPQEPAVLMFDEGRVKTLRPVDIDYSPPFSDRHVRQTYLIPDDVRKFDKDNADWAVSFTPAWRTGQIWESARQLAASQPSNLTRYLVSGNPLVVALSPQPAGASGAGVRPITLADTDARAIRLLVLEPWNNPPTAATVMELGDGMTLREILDRTPWK